MIVYVCYPDVDDRTEFTLFRSEMSAIGFFAELLQAGDTTVGQLYNDGWIVVKILN